MPAVLLPPVLLPHVLLVLAGCAMGPSDETLLDELRILAIQADPPEATPGGMVTLTALVADPLADGAELLLWHCTDLGDGCLEDGTPHTWSGTMQGDTVSFDTTVPAALSAVATEDPLPVTVLWGLACEPGLCPQVASPEDWDLSDPTSWLEDLPMSGVSLAYRTLAVSTRADVADNPSVALQGDAPPSVSVEDEVELTFSVDLSVTATAETLAFGFTTAGGFGETGYAIGDDGAVTLTWYAPADPGTATLYVVVQDGEGGVGTWVQNLVVE